ncbi:MAG: zinc-finger domain-containing protein [Robiginitomaculum sp.]|nr:zinc-finger domain-containing protein [Robiginitomaculum sp.]
MANTKQNPRSQALDTIVTSSRVSCDGGGGVSGHPKVYYDLNDDGEAWCFYCSKHFIRKGSAADKT